MQHQKLTILLLACIVLLQNCTKHSSNTPVPPVVTPQPNLPSAPFNYSNVIFPPHVAASLLLNDNTPVDNPITNDGATLGRVLFYDKALSKNSTISCASCHSPEQSFTDAAQFSRGFEGGLTPRASMQILNERFYRSGRMFWDERSNTLEHQVLQPVQNHIEMGLSITDLEQKIRAINYYPLLFTKAFGNAVIDSVRIAKALSQFIRSIVTYQSKYDLVKQGLQTFTAEEADGERIFLTAGNISCGGCHTPPMFITSQPQAPFALPDPLDPGVGTPRRFKSPSLRNVVNTAPYFHNGSVATLEAVIGTGIPAHTVPPADRQRLLAFMRTLTDVTVTTDPKFSDPFK